MTNALDFLMAHPPLLVAVGALLLLVELALLHVIDEAWHRRTLRRRRKPAARIPFDREKAIFDAVVQISDHRRVG